LRKGLKRDSFLSIRKKFASLASEQYNRLCAVEIERPVLDVAREICATAKLLKPGCAGALEEVIDNLTLGLNGVRAFDMVRIVSSFRHLTKSQNEAMKDYKHTLRSYIQEFNDELEAKAEVEMRTLATAANPSTLEKAKVPQYLLSVAYRVHEFIGEVVEMEDPSGWTKKVDRVVAAFSSKTPLEKVKKLCASLNKDGNANL
jgi:hypothetical protein